jgi:hypothetical protein
MLSSDEIYFPARELRQKKIYVDYIRCMYPSYSTFHIASFRTGHLDTLDEEHSEDQLK